jgi:hypothetical protein
MDTQNSNVSTNDTILDNTPSVVNINITCQSGSRLVLNNNLNIPSSVFTDEIETEYETGNSIRTQTHTQTHTEHNTPSRSSGDNIANTTNTTNTTNTINTPSAPNAPNAPNTNDLPTLDVPPGLLPTTSRVFFTVNPSGDIINRTTGTTNVNNLTRNLIDMFFPANTTTSVDSVSGVNIVSNTQQMQPPNEGLSLNDLRNYTTLTTYSPNDNVESVDLKCEICHDNINETDILRMVNVCNHSFHQECVDSWFENNKICPYCRGNVIEEVDINADMDVNMDANVDVNAEQV